MKKSLFLLLLVVLGSCSKDNNSGNGLSRTKLRLKIIDDQGNLVSGASVKLYLTEENLKNDVGITNQGVTGGDGVIIFNDVFNQVYFYSINAGCLSNNIFASRALSLQFDVIHDITFLLPKVSSLVLKNKSTHPFSIQISQNFEMTMNGGTTLELIRKVIVGNIKVRVLQLSGYTSNPIDITYDKVTVCDGTEYIEFP